MASLKVSLQRSSCISALAGTAGDHWRGSCTSKGVESCAASTLGRSRSTTREASLEAEKIFTTSVDFIPAAVHAVLWYVLGTVQRLRYDDIDTLDDLSLEQLLGLLPAWFSNLAQRT